ncbi:MAG: phosphatidate cytidylyltransferase [Oscillospiraceae bacterium]|nr:phosphatidate cytidylyltransferase [Oscillospiraceae bacterium]
MKTRVKTGAVLVAAAVLVLYFSHLPWVLGIAVALLSAAAVYELYGAVGLHRNGSLFLVSTVAAVALALIPWPGYDLLLTVLLIAAMVLFGVLMGQIGKVRALKAWQVMFAAAVLSVFFGSMVHIRAREFGLWELTMGIIVCMVTDSFAYLVGCRFGRHKLAPKVSPAKSIEGSIGGTAAAVIVMLLLNLIIRKAGGPGVHYGKMTVYLFIVSLVGQYGDLCLSAVKRIAGVKDYGHLLPGHGGILDRFDSQLFALPFTYLFCTICGNLYY